MNSAMQQGASESSHLSPVSEGGRNQSDHDMETNGVEALLLASSMEPNKRLANGGDLGQLSDAASAVR